MEKSQIPPEENIETSAEKSRFAPVPDERLMSRRIPNGFFGTTAEDIPEFLRSTPKVIPKP